MSKIILTKKEQIPFDTRKNGINLNTLVIGGAGTGFTRSCALPNIMQMNASYVINDNGGVILRNTGKMLIEAGYDIKVLNLNNPVKSMKYNPLQYIRLEEDLLQFVDIIFANTKSETDGSEFFVQAERLYITALIGVIIWECPCSDHKMDSLLYFMQHTEFRNDDDEFKDAVDITFDDIEKDFPELYAVKCYRNYKLAAGKNAEAVYKSCLKRFAVFAGLQDFTDNDELALNEISNKKTALFVIPNMFDSFGLISAMLHTQLINILHEKVKSNGFLEIPTRFIMDDFVGCGVIPRLHLALSSIGSKDGISFDFIVQNLPQLQQMYPETWELIAKSCDSLLFFGGNEKNTLEYISKITGMSAFKMAETLPSGKCAVKIQGQNPKIRTAYQLEKHPNYRLTADFSKENEFNLEKFIMGGY